MSLIEAIVQSTIFVLEILSCIAFVVILALIVLISYFTGDKYNHGGFGALIGAILAFWLFLIVNVILDQNI